MLIDRGQKPKWKPATLEEVTKEEVLIIYGFITNFKQIDKYFEIKSNL